MNFIVFLIVGLIAGAIAKAVMPGSRSEPGGWLMTMLLGVVGAYVGGFAANMLGIGGGGLITSIILAAIGAMILIGLMRLFSGRSRTV
jgi:uncharacterized membrane protein YeaQ/YmgE (transglycosylase-associated protein family)